MIQGYNVLTTIHNNNGLHYKDSKNFNLQQFLNIWIFRPGQHSILPKKPGSSKGVMLLSR
jgi:hypothetical protein